MASFIGVLDAGEQLGAELLEIDVVLVGHTTIITRRDDESGEHPETLHPPGDMVSLPLAGSQAPGVAKSHHTTSAPSGVTSSSGITEAQPRSGIEHPRMERLHTHHAATSWRSKGCRPCTRQTAVSTSTVTMPRP
jgi:hypothetical protein